MEGLIISRHKNEVIVADLRKHGLGLIQFMPIEIRGDKVRLMINADRGIPVHRKEVFDAIERAECREGGDGKSEPGRCET